MTAAFASALRLALLIWSAVTFLPAWLIAIRGLCDGDDYAWSLGGRLKGRGTGGAYVVAPATAAFGLTMLTFGWRGVGRPFHLMLAAWHCPLAIVATIASQRNREALRVQGDTLGIDVSLADVAPPLFGGVAMGTAALAALDRRRNDPPARTGVNRRLLGLAIALLPIQFTLLRTGEQDGVTDKLGVLLTIVQWLLIYLGLAGVGRNTVSQ